PCEAYAAAEKRIELRNYADYDSVQRCDSSGGRQSRIHLPAERENRLSDFWIRSHGGLFRAFTFDLGCRVDQERPSVVRCPASNFERFSLAEDQLRERLPDCQRPDRFTARF